MTKSEEINNLDIALFALYKLNGISQKVHTERVAFECFRLAKERFSWRLNEYRDFPDKTPVRFALEQAKKKENGSLVIGKAGGDFSGNEREGWKLTLTGVQWIKENSDRIAKILKQEKPELPKHEVGRFIKKIKTDIAFINYKRDGNLDKVSRYNFTDLLDCPPDADSEIKKQKFMTLQTTAELIKDFEIIEFLEHCREKFFNTN